MADEIPQTPVPVPTYGQPQPMASASTPAAAVAQSQTGEAPADPEAQTVAPKTEPSDKDVSMMDASSADQAADQAASPAPAAPSTNAPSPAPARTGTPLRTNGQENTSRAASQHPDPAFTMPDTARVHGAPVRQYLNSKITPHLLEAMKEIGRAQPKDPLRILGEFLLARSKEVEK